MCEVMVFFWSLFWQNWLMFPKHYKHRYFSTFLKQKKPQMTISMVIIR